jgi:hypothetical protein
VRVTEGEGGGRSRRGVVIAAIVVVLALIGGTGAVVVARRRSEPPCTPQAARTALDASHDVADELGYNVAQPACSGSWMQVATLIPTNGGGDTWLLQAKNATTWKVSTDGVGICGVAKAPVSLTNCPRANAAPTLRPAKTPAANPVCEITMDTGQDGSADPLGCPNAGVNEAAWNYYARLHLGVLALGPKANSPQVEMAMCNDIRHRGISIPAEDDAEQLAAAYNAWAFTFDPSTLSGGC